MIKNKCAFEQCVQAVDEVYILKVIDMEYSIPPPHLYTPTYNI